MASPELIPVEAAKDGPSTMDRILRRSWNRWDNVVPGYIRSACLLWQFVKFSYQFYICTRQITVLNIRRRIPRPLFGRLAPETFERARNYNKDMVYLEMVSCLYWVIYEVWCIYYAGFTKIWFLSGPLLDWTNLWNDEWDRETGETIVFTFLFVCLSNVVAWPFEIYQNFWIEAKYGFNKMSVFDYFWDRVKLTFMEFLWTVLAAVVILWIVRTSGSLFFLWVWLFCFVWLVATLAIYPNVIAPMFNEYSKLREGRLRSRLNRLALFIGFPLNDILVIHQKWKSEHRDAYFIGLIYSKKIVLYDTLLDGYPEADTDTEAIIRRNRQRLKAEAPTHPPSSSKEENDETASSPSLARQAESRISRAKPDTAPSRETMSNQGFTEFEVEAICARLMGHWMLSHSIQEMVFPEISLFLFFLIFSHFYENSTLFQAFAVPKSMDKPIILGLKLLFMDVMDIYKLFVDQVMRYLARNRELETDNFATRLGYGDDLIDAIIELNKENLGYPYFDSWYWSFHYWEPSLLERILEIEAEMERMEWRNR